MPLYIHLMVQLQEDGKLHLIKKAFYKLDYMKWKSNETMGPNVDMCYIY